MDGAPATDDASSGAAGPGASQDSWQSVMIDVSGLSLTELADEDETVLARSLRRIATDLAQPGEPIAGFNSAF